jgi:hypothetical protein
MYNKSEQKFSSLAKGGEKTCNCHKTSVPASRRRNESRTNDRSPLDVAHRNRTVHYHLQIVIGWTMMTTTMTTKVQAYQETTTLPMLVKSMSFRRALCDRRYVYVLSRNFCTRLRSPEVVSASFRSQLKKSNSRVAVSSDFNDF